MISSPKIFLSKIKLVLSKHGLFRGSFIIISKFLRIITLKLFKKKHINPWPKCPPYKYVQDITEHNIHSYLGVPSTAINSWCIVGGFNGEEIPNILSNYGQCKVTVFECSERYVNSLKSKFKSSQNVKVVQKAVSNKSGIAVFFEVSGTGSGSLLKLGELSSKSYGMTQEETFQVETTTLDKFFGKEVIDVLQIDVQGAEKLVLEGAKDTLKTTKAVFTEISIKPEMYKDSITFDELNNLLTLENFQLVLLGTDTNGGGNALFIKKEYIGDTILTP